MFYKYNYFNILLFLACIFFIYHLDIFINYSMVSPDSIRFMKLWQINFDKYGFIKAIFHSMKDSIIYDGNRSRYMQYILYGLDVLIRKNGSNNSYNILSFIIIFLNNILISLMIVKNYSNNKLNIFLLILTILNSTIFFYGPIIDIVLYGKMIWLTFIILFFIFNDLYLKILMLFMASISDEFGLFSTLIISTYHTFLYLYKINYELKKIILISLAIPVIIFTSINGINAIIFNLGSGFSSFFITFGGESLKFSLIQRLDSSIEYLLNLIFGSIIIFNNTPFILNCLKIILLVLLSLLSIIYIPKNFLNKYKNDLQKIIYNYIINLIINNYNFLIWLFIFILINLIVLPGGGSDFGHRGYAKAMIVSILFFTMLMNFRCSYRFKQIFLFIVIILHSTFFIFNNNVNKIFTNNISHFFIGDTSIKWEDLQIIKKSVSEYNQFNNSKTFESINNNQEIDYSGTWYYSRISNYDTTKKSYFPVKGTVDVLIWPKKTH